ncbi:MAG: LPS export ABC transporter periplasmic protein LptC [Thiovulaceae bacterium]|nr:LPS export ABC transporter periplasmic protein LptC [Sulfurimonadaceae bacterium]MCW9026420.1 LPS export ABC transporter periplasmic protein LptC [Sulfurimonadaceae bacterium]
MNINIFLFIVMIGLSMIYFLFKPMNFKQTQDKEIAQFSLTNFTLNELDKSGLITKMNGDEAIRYNDRYLVENINYTDNTKEFLANMKAKKGLYKKNIVYLNGDVKFKREDGVRFFSQKATYNKNTDVASSDVEYVAYIGENYVTGDSVTLDNKNNIIKSKNIYAIYNLEEKKKK